ncbi:MAG TPA: Rieske 2Fe-2S domain-containing protein [Stellaceae bacterium]|nr:Rieske 2Fe-2S domain-containing protein [Stellaceae bacterium]
MLVTRQQVLRRFWYPVMPVSRLGDEPQPFTLLGRDIVLWRAPDGAIACLKDRCCHRTAKLSLGFVEDGRLVCGYPGWTYGRTASACASRSVRIPRMSRPACAFPPIAWPSASCWSSSISSSRALADRYAVMERGAVVLSGEPRDMVESDVRRYLTV